MEAVSMQRDEESVRWHANQRRALFRLQITRTELVTVKSPANTEALQKQSL